MSQYERVQAAAIRGVVNVIYLQKQRQRLRGSINPTIAAGIAMETLMSIANGELTTLVDMRPLSESGQQGAHVQVDLYVESIPSGGYCVTADALTVQQAVEQVLTTILETAA